jgi:thiol-disulfide isomerase/thioredoxin
MHRTRLLVVVVACLLVAVAVVAAPASHPFLRKAAYAIGILHPVPPLHVGQRFPTFRVADLDGSAQTVSGDDARGTVIYNVFTSWCPSCRDEAPIFAGAASRLAHEGVRVVGIDQAESPAAISRFEQTYGISYPILIDTDSASSALLSVRVIPETIVVHDGIVRAIAVGPVDASFLDQAARV